MNIHCISINGRIEEEAFNTLMHLVSREKRDKIERYLRREDAQRALVADILVRVLVCKKTGIRNKELDFFQNKFGKPFIRNAEGFFFNVSHSGEWVVCAINDAETGIDVEKLKDPNIDIAKSFFSREEYEDLIHKDECMRLSYFYDLWTLKESYVKALGKGFSEPLDSFTIKIQGDAIRCISRNNPDNLSFRKWDLDSEYKLAVCSCNIPREVYLNVQSFEDFYETEISCLKEE
jgi:4'-phosphopantetheinyl transferase